MSTTTPNPTPDAPTPWGKLNSGQGYNIIAVDLDRAIAFARLSHHEAAILQQVREGCWAAAIRLGRKPAGGAWPTAASCRIELKSLAEQTGFGRTQLGNARKSLLASKILVDRGDGFVGINKHADQWILPRTGTRRLSARLLEFCRAVQVGAAPSLQQLLPFEGAFRSSASPHIRVTAEQYSDCEAVQRPRCTASNADPTRRATPGEHETPAPYKNGREEDIPKSKQEHPAPRVAADLGRGGGGTKSGPPASAEPPKAPPGPGSNSAQADDLAAWASRYGQDVAKVARDWCDYLPAEWIRSLVMRYVVGDARHPRAKAGVLRKILSRTYEIGVLDCDLAPGRPAAKRPSPPVTYYQAKPDDHPPLDQASLDALRARIAAQKANGTFNRWWEVAAHA